MYINREKRELHIDEVSKQDLKKNRLSLVKSINEINKLKELTGIKKGRLEILTPLIPIIRELCDCLTINAYQASITLTNHLLEKALKMALILNEGRVNINNNDLRIDEVFKDAYNKYDSILMEDAIKKCCSLNLINKDEKKKLIEIKQQFRNPYSHAETTKILKNVTSKVTIGYLGGFKMTEEQNINVDMTPIFQGDAQLAVAKRDGCAYFRLAIYIIMVLDQNLKERYK